MNKDVLTVQLEKDAPGWFAKLAELNLHANGRTQQQALEKLADIVLDYWFNLREDESLRRTEPCQQHYQFYVRQLWPAILERLQRPTEPSENPLLPLIAYRSASLWLKGVGSLVKSDAF